MVLFILGEYLQISLVNIYSDQLHVAAPLSKRNWRWSQVPPYNTRQHILEGNLGFHIRFKCTCWAGWSMRWDPEEEWWCFVKSWRKSFWPLNFQGTWFWEVFVLRGRISILVGGSLLGSNDKQVMKNFCSLKPKLSKVKLNRKIVNLGSKSVHTSGWSVKLL